MMGRLEGIVKNWKGGWKPMNPGIEKRNRGRGRWEGVLVWGGK
jgi:hypothetical protein